MNSSVWAVWAAQGSKEKKYLRFSEQLLRVVFSTFGGQKKRFYKRDIMQLFSADATIFLKNLFFFAHKKLKKYPEK